MPASPPNLLTVAVDRTASPLWAVIRRSSGANGPELPTNPPIWNWGCSEETKATWAAPVASIAALANPPATNPSSDKALVIATAVLIVISEMAAPLRILKASSAFLRFFFPNLSIKSADTFATLTYSWATTPNVSVIWAALSRASCCSFFLSAVFCSSISCRNFSAS